MPDGGAPHRDTLASEAPTIRRVNKEIRASCQEHYTALKNGCLGPHEQTACARKEAGCCRAREGPGAPLDATCPLWDGSPAVRDS